LVAVGIVGVIGLTARTVCIRWVIAVVRLLRCVWIVGIKRLPATAPPPSSSPSSSPSATATTLAANLAITLLRTLRRIRRCGSIGCTLALRRARGSVGISRKRRRSIRRKNWLLDFNHLCR
jgi:hypothetical protein